MRKKGIAAAPGVAIAKVYVYNDEPIILTRKKIKDKDLEIKRFQVAIRKSRLEILELKESISKNMGEDEAEIFLAHLSILEDPRIINAVYELLEQKYNSSFAYRRVIDEVEQEILSSNNKYLEERIIDIEDVAKRVFSHLGDYVKDDISKITEPIILVANDLTPSDTVMLNPKVVKGIISASGGKTSHTAILARTLGIPAIVGLEITGIRDNDILILDGMNGDVIVKPTIEEIGFYEKKIHSYQKHLEKLKKLVNVKTLTKDGSHIELAANITAYSESDDVINEGAEGVGLFRTEFLYMGIEDFPTEETHFNAYKEVLSKVKDKVVIRTFDIGGDKNLDYLPMKKEVNPFLGHRALRLSLSHQDMFKTQLRAMLRASIYGNLHIMFPMVSTLEELIDAKQIVKECELELIKQGHEVSKYKIGIMIEVPSAALFVKELAKEADFFSVGTNDLIQYVFAADRLNEQVSYLYQPYHPVIIRLLKEIIDTAHKENKWVGVCGEMAGTKKGALLLLGLGIDELSMNVKNILEIRDFLKNVDKNSAREIANQSLNLRSSKEVEVLIHKYFDMIEKETY